MEPELSETARRILADLRRQGKATNKDLLDRTGLGRRSVYRALQHLMALGVVQRRPNLRDTRSAFYIWDDQAARKAGLDG